MGKHLRRKHSGIAFENNHPGCLWGILHILDSHHWRNVKKMLPYKRHAHGDGRHAKGNNINVRNAGNMQEHIDAQMDHSIIEGKMREPSPATKSSVKARIKALIAEEMCKKKGQHHRSLTFPAQSQLTRTDSIHHLEPSEQDPLAEIILNVESPRISHQDNENPPATCTLDPLPPKASGTMLTVNHLGHSQVDNEHGKQLVENHTLLQEKLDQAKQALLEQKLIYATEHTRDAPLYQSKESLDALDIVNLSKELFLKILQDQGSPLAHHFHGQQAFSTNIGLAKSGSFPITGLSGTRASGPSKSQKSAEFESTEDISELSMPLMTENRVNGNSKPNQAKHETADNASPGSPLQMKNGSENRVVIKRFKVLKLRLKHAIRESRKERHRITMDAVLHKIPYGRKFSNDVNKEIGHQWKEPAMDRGGKDSPASSYESDHSGPVLSKGRLRHIRRTSSFSGSLDRYCQLYESSFNRQSRYHISERLKLRTEEVGLPGGSAPKSLGRILSLPNLKSYFYLQSEYLQSEDSFDAFSSRTPIGTIVDKTISIGSSFDERKTLELPIGSENQMHLNVLMESGSQENLVEVSELNPVIRDQVGSTSIANGEANAEVGLIIDNSGNLTEPSLIPVLESSFQEDITSPAKFSISEANSELKPRHLLFGGPDSWVDQHYESSMDSPAVAESGVNLEKVELPSEHLESDSLHVQVDTKDKAEFHYVRDVLELSGFSRNELLRTWHTGDQLLRTWHTGDQLVDPSVYEEVEGCVPCDHMLLFDLINEVLMEIYERSFTYCPMPLSSFSHIRPMPAGHHVLEEVWANMSWYLSSRPEPDQSLDYVASRDLAKGNGWMNLQFDTECVGLELEDSIFDDLLEEVLWT